MGQPAARMTDNVLQAVPHRHAPIQPVAPVPTPVPHPAIPLMVVKGEVPSSWNSTAQRSRLTRVFWLTVNSNPGQP